MSYLTPDELALIQRLPRDAPYVFTGVSGSQLSIARYYGGCTFRNFRYIYHPPTDELIRDDVMRLVTCTRKAAEKAARTARREAAMNAQGSLL